MELLDTALGRAHAPRRFAVRLLRIGMHLAGGLAVATLVFPFASPAARLAHAGRWARRTIGGLGVRLQVEGAAVAPGALLVANHVSWLDILAIASHAPAVFVAKEEVRGWPVIGWLATRAGTLFLRRTSGRSLLRVKNGIAARLLAGRTVAIFPEGTTTDGSGVLPFRSGLLQAALDSGRPVQPVAIAYRGEDGGRSAAAAFTGAMNLWQSIGEILRSPRITLHLTVAAPLAPAGRTRKELAGAAQRAITTTLASPTA